MDGVAYLIGDIILGGLLVIIAGQRRDLRAKMPFLGLLGGCAAVIGELFFYRDYWRPPALALLPLEDFVFGFVITALGFALYPYLFRLRFGSRTHPRRLKLYGALFAIGLASMLLLNIVLGIPSIFVNVAMLGIFSVVLLLIRRDLIQPGLYAAVTGVLIMGTLYTLFFDILEPNFWSRYWLLAGTRWGASVLGNVPVTELLWYGTWFLFACISYPFVSGRILVRQPQV